MPFAVLSGKGTAMFSTSSVIATAITPSENASSRFVPTRVVSPRPSRLLPRPGSILARHALRRADPGGATGPRLPDREALDHSGPVSVVAERPAAGLQPGDQSRPGHGLRRDHGSRGGVSAFALRADPPGQRPRQPNRQIPASG